MCALQRLLGRHPGCSWTSDHLGYAKQKLIELEHKRDEFYFHGFRSRWSQKGDRCTKEFFQMTKPKNVFRGIRHLKWADGTLTEDLIEMCHIATERFKQLLTAENLSSDMVDCRQTLWAQISLRVSATLQAQLLQPFTIEELASALQDLPRHSCPGIDGLTPGFFLQYWYLIKEDLQLAFDIGHLSEAWAVGLIFLIPKGDLATDEISQ